MATTVDARVSLTSSPGKGEAVGIGEASRRVGLTRSAIRFYESEGLLDAPQRRDGRRRYSPDDLRALTFIALGREFGLGLAAIRRALRPGPGGWASVVDAQITALDEQIARAQRAKEMLVAGRECPASEPVRNCPYLRAALDALMAGAPLPPPGADAGRHSAAAAGNAATDGDG